MVKLKGLNSNFARYIMLLVAEFSLRFIFFIYYYILYRLVRPLRVNAKITLFPFCEFVIDDYRYMFHKKSIQLSYISHNNNIDMIEKYSERTYFDNLMPNVDVYVLSHTGAYYTTVSKIIISHEKGSVFFVPMMDDLVKSSVSYNIKKLELLGYIILIGSVSDRRFITRMFRRNESEKVIIFPDLPPGLIFKENKSSTVDVILFERKSRLFSGVYKLLKNQNTSYTIVTSEHNPISRDVVYFSEEKSYVSDQDVSKDIENSISKSLKNWKYLDVIEFYYQ
ncbi:TPA: hypothetical protein ACGU7E_003134 [Vibrio vulnificus]|uniref:hypothetical protein n=1 Tax=Vibrio vulnificus TaxID=672 RepID=UPI0005024A6B|nr:hypothetical protein [Vibrio vulnificus]EHY1014995.1 hypothetical protein [Vibrio vulnificus]EHY1122650.1 hypothetical protein [Vibrio vulnificus]KFK48400.1 hypothetical protein JS87_21830 [Vibrio vulnificus]HDY7474874.1 hypothetical protein [Vibrio vulnificus]HDY7817911.1 hypothetical protein [Vibrio vulnificus]